MADIEGNNLQIELVAKVDLDVRHVSIKEGMSDLFQINVLAITQDARVDLEQIVDRGAIFRIGIEDDEAPARLWAGIVAHMAQVHASEDGVSAYRIVIVPTLWRTTQRTNSRIFQHKTTPMIVEEILKEWKISVDTSKLQKDAYRKHEYCVQYQESDYAFISRLLEDAGISFYFVNAKKSGVGEDITKLVLNDAPHRNDARKGALAYLRHGAPNHGASDFVTMVALGQRMRPGKLTLRDFDFRGRSDSPLYASTHLVDGKSGPSPEASYEVYDYSPGALWWRIGDPKASPPSIDKGDAGTIPPKEWTATVERALRSARRGDVIASFHTNAIDLGPGAIVGINQGSEETPHHPHAYLAPEGGAGTTDQGKGEPPKLLVTEVSFFGDHDGKWTMTASAVFADEDYRPPRKTPKPRIAGVQSAIVVGPNKEEIHTDEYRRVRVQFHWDREGKYDDNSSCWMRVSQPWAGGAYGIMNIPRVGHEVLVSFLEGDPDRPIITGRLYNTTNAPAYDLPSRKTVSYWRTSSSPGGVGYNEVAFEDHEKQEYIHVQAQKDLASIVKHSESADIGVHRGVRIGESDVLHVGKARTVVVGEKHHLDTGEVVNVRVGAKTDDVVTELLIANGLISMTTKQASVVLAQKNIVINAKGTVSVVSGQKVHFSNASHAQTIVDKSGTVTIQGALVNINPGGPSAPNAKAEQAGKALEPPTKPAPGDKIGPPWMPNGHGQVALPGALKVDAKRPPRQAKKPAPVIAPPAEAPPKAPAPEPTKPPACDKTVPPIDPGNPSTCDYYQKRYDSFVSRHPGCHSPPDYYLNYGKKYCIKFSTELYAKLSPEGKKWLERARTNLQLAIEAGLRQNPEMELDSKAFRSFAFETHPDAYINAGLHDLSILDKMKVASTPDLKEWLNLETWQQAGEVAKSEVGKYKDDAVQGAKDAAGTVKDAVTDAAKNVTDYIKSKF